MVHLLLLKTIRQILFDGGAEKAFTQLGYTGARFHPVFPLHRAPRLAQVLRFELLFEVRRF